MSQAFLTLLTLLLIIALLFLAALVFVGITAVIGLVAYRARNHQLAITCFTINTILARRTYLPHYYLALAYHQAGQLKNAVVEYQKAKSINPARLEPYYQLADVYLILNQADHSLLVLQELLNMNSIRLKPEQKQDLQGQIKALQARVNG